MTQIHFVLPVVSFLRNFLSFSPPSSAKAVRLAISKGLNETCCAEKVHGEAFNLACEEMPDQRAPCFWRDLGYFGMGNGGKNWVKHVKIKHVTYLTSKMLIW